MTVLELITAALHRLGYLEATETPLAHDVDAVKTAANALIDEMKLDGLLCYRISRNVFNLVASTASYSIGSGATFDVSRPSEIVRAGIILDPSASVPREIPIEVLSIQDYALIRNKTFEAVYPTAVYFDPEMTVDGYGAVKVFPVPSSSTPDLVLYLRETVDELGANDVDLDLAPGYRRMLITNIAMEAAPVLGMEPTSSLVLQARESRMAVMRANVRVDELSIGGNVPGMGISTRYDIERG